MRLRVKRHGMLMRAGRAMWYFTLVRLTTTMSMLGGVTLSALLVDPYISSPMHTAELAGIIPSSGILFGAKVTCWFSSSSANSVSPIYIHRSILWQSSSHKPTQHTDRQIAMPFFYRHHPPLLPPKSMINIPLPSPPISSNDNNAACSILVLTLPLTRKVPTTSSRRYRRRQHLRSLSGSSWST